MKTVSGWTNRTKLCALGRALAAFSLIAGPGTQGQDFRITSVKRTEATRVQIEYGAPANAILTLLQGTSVTNITVPVGTNRSVVAGSGQFSFSLLTSTPGRFFRIQQSSGPPSPPQPVTLIPVSGSSEVGVTVRPKALFPQPVNTATLNTNNFYASFAGQKLPASIVSANDGTFAWLFFEAAMPNASQIQVSIDGSTILTRSGAALDADADGQPGGMVQFTFSTVSVEPVPGTVLAGRIVDPGRDLQPRTFDDIRLDASQNVTFLNPIAGVKVYLLGMEGQFAVTDTNGWFQLNSVPVGDVKLAIEGPTAATPHPGFYWPQMVIDSQTHPGITNYITMIGRDPGANLQYLQTIYLPRIGSNVLQTINADATNTVLLQSDAAYNLPPQQQPYLSLQIQPNSLVGMDGQPLSAAQVGLSVVPPELVRDMLPPGLLQHTFDITIQAPGVATFATPAPMTFPNVFNAPPGTKLNFLSFDHTTGRLVIEGTATVAADGLSVSTDPGAGITHPGWHGLTPPGVNGGGGGGGGPNGGGGPPDPGCPDCSKPKNCDTERKSAISAVAQCAVGVAAAIPKSTPVIGCAIGFGLGAIGATVDCNISFSDCGKSIGLNTVGVLVGCIPVIGGALGATWGCGLQAGTALIDYNGCLSVIGNTRERAAAPQIPQNIFLEQQALWAAAADVYAIVLGDPKWTVIDPADFPQVQAIFLALQASLDPSSPGGERIIQSERDAILQLPLPANISTADAGAMLTRFDELMGRQVPTGGLDLQALSSAASNLVQVATLLEARGWQTTFDAYLRGIPNLAAEQDLALKDESAGGTVSLVPSAFYKLTSLSDGFVQRGRMPGKGSFDQLFMAADSFFTLEYVDPATARVALTAFRTGPSGSALTIPRAIFVDSLSPDTDGDGLSDEAEDIIGTDPRKASTCGDGISDFAKVQQGLDLTSCLPAPTGIIASLALPGEAQEVVLEGSTTDSRQQTAYLACGSRGLSIVNVTTFQKPILLGQLDLPGDATDVAVDSKLKIAVVAANSGGLHLVDISDPIRPKLLRTINAAASEVEVLEGIAYAPVGPALNSYDLLTGDRLQTLPLGNAVQGFAREALFLYALDKSLVLHVVDVGGPAMIARGSLTMPNGGRKIFVGGGIAYVAAGNGFTGGFATANVSDPDRPVVISGVDAANIEGDAIAANGSGLALTAGFVGNPAGGGISALDVLNVSDPANTGNFVSRFLLPSAPIGVAIGSGIGFVADGTNGLQVVNYAAADNRGVAPVVSMVTASTTALEGSLLPVAIKVSDDVQVRKVELLVNGHIVQTDVSFPFDLIAALPLLAAGSSNAVLQVRATDTGGNIGLSTAITIQLVPDLTPPTVASIVPPNNSSRGVGFRIVTIDWSELLDETTVTAENIQLTGANGVVLPQNIQFRRNGAEVQLTYPPLGLGSYQLILKGAALKDRVGNALGANVVSNFSVSGGLAEWSNPNGGFWDVPSNWGSGVLPGPADDVFISVPGDATVTIRQGVINIHSLTVNNTLALSGGRIIGATISSGTGGQIVVTNTPGVGKTVLDGVTLASDVTLGDPTLTTSLTVTNGLTLSGAKVILQTLQFASAELIFTGTQTLGGTGEVVFAGKSGILRTYGDTTAEGADVLTIGPGITVHGIRTAATSDDSSTVSGRSFDTIVNEGTIIADVANQEIRVFWDGPQGQFINRGTLRTDNGGILTVRGMLNQGTVSANAGSQLSLQGSQETLGSWMNMATIAVTNSTLTISGNWTNNGTITSVNSTVNLEGSSTTAGLGTFNRTGGTVNLIADGFLDNTGATFALDATTGSWNLVGGTIKGGTITSSGGATLVVDNRGGGTLDGVNLQMALTVAGSSILAIKNGLTLNGLPLTLAEFGGSLSFLGTQLLGGTGDIVFTGTDTTKSFFISGGGSQAQAATLTIGPNIRIHGSAAVFPGAPFDTIINQGTITSDTSGQTITLGSADANLITVINQGTIQALNGGQIALAGDDRNAGQLTPGNPPQVMAVRGTYTQLPAGSINVHIGGTAAGTGFSQVDVTGAVTLAGTLNLTLINGYEPAIGDAFPIILGASVTGQFSVVNGLVIGNGKRFDLNYSATGLSLTVVASP